jgi:hypothetical protein
LIGIKEKEDEDLQSLYTLRNRQERMRIGAFFFFTYGIRAIPPLALSSSDPRTREAAQLRAGSPQKVRSPAAREAAAVRR